MRIDKWKYQIACARVCMKTGDVLEKSGVKRSSFYNCTGRQGGTPDTIGKIARALGVDVLDILTDEDVKKYASASGKDGDTC